MIQVVCLAIKAVIDTKLYHNNQLRHKTIQDLWRSSNRIKCRSEEGERSDLPVLIPMWFSSSYLIEITRWSKQNTFLLTSRYVLLWEVDLCSCRQELDPEDRELSKLKVGDFLAISQNAAEFTVQKLGTLRQADPALAVVRSGPRLHLDNRNFQCPDFRNWTNLLEDGQ